LDWIIGLFFLVFGASGCATVREGIPQGTAVVQEGVYHKVQKGQTLWRIAQIYQVSLADIIISNNIPDAATIEENQLIFIPGAEDILEIPPFKQDLSQSEFIWPVDGRIVAYFGDRQGLRRQQGVELATLSQQPVKASRGGRIVFADYLTGYDYTVIVDHQDGYFSIYGKNSKILVGLGDMVSQGDQIAKTRAGGKGTFYFEIRKDTVAENPLYYLPQR